MNIEILKQSNGTHLVSLLSGDDNDAEPITKEQAEKEARRITKVYAELVAKNPDVMLAYRCEIKRKG